MLTDEQLWEKCGSGQRITFEDIGLDPSKHRNGTQILREGFTVCTFVDVLKEFGVTLLIILAISLFISLT